jgi:diguanylate cyclase (GGDEF)-like protein
MAKKRGDDAEDFKKRKRWLALHLAEEIVEKPAPEAIQNDPASLKFVANLVKKGVHRDAVTKIPNRWAYDERIVRAISRASRGRDVCVGWLDIDNFKAINTKYTHDGGDVALAHVVKIASDSVYKTDLVARVGSDEFAVIFWDATEDKAREKLKEIREKIKTTPCRYKDKAIPVTVSFGYHKVEARDTPETITQTCSNSMLTQKEITKEMQSPLTPKIVQGQFTFDEEERRNERGGSGKGLK